MAEVQLPLHQKTMSSRYPPKNILEIRGYSGTSSKSIKFMDKAETNFKFYPPSLTHINSKTEPLMDTLVDLLDDNNEHEYQAVPNRHHNNSWNEESNEGWTSTGVMSDRSSVYSIDDADFDREASRKVNNQLKEIEAILYEQNLSYRPILVECKEWLDKFPHLRVLGNQIPNVPKEEGFQLVESKFSNPVLQKQQSINSNNTANNNNNNNKLSNDEPSRYSKRRDLSDLSSSQGLLVNGLYLPVKVVEVTDKTPEYKFLEEEIFEEEGNYEELFAYDNREDEYLLEHNKRLNINKRRRRNLPPVTPKAAIKDMVLNLLFDHIWSEIINWSSETIKRYAKSITTSNSANYLTLTEPSMTHSTPLINDARNSIVVNDNNNNNNKNIQNNTNNTQTNNNNTNLKNTKNIANNNSLENNNKSSNNNNNNTNGSNLKNPSNANNFAANILPLNPNNNNINNNLNNQEKQLYPRTTTIQFSRNTNNENNEFPLPPSRDSTFYLQSNKTLRNHSSLTNENISNSLDRNTLNASTLESIDPLVGLDNFLLIKQLNKNGNTNKSKISPNLNTNNNPPTSNSRLGSGSRKQYSMIKKRYQINETASFNGKTPLDTIHDKNIVVHGAAVVKPVNNHNENNRNHNLNNNNNEISKIVNNYAEEDKSAANDFDDDDDYYDASVSVGIPHNQNYGADNDNFDENNSMSTAIITNSRHDYSLNMAKKLPPIETLLKAKTLRISSANNSKQSREKTERPMTTTATRYENLPINKRVTTPLMQVNTNLTRSSGLSNLLSSNIQITGIRYSNDETSSTVSGATNQMSTISTNNKIISFSSQSSRKNSIRDSIQNSRVHNK